MLSFMGVIHILTRRKMLDMCIPWYPVMICTFVLVSHNYVCVLLYIIIYKVIYCTLTQGHK